MAEVKIGKLCLGQMQTNCYFVYREGESEVMLFDPASAGKHIADKLAENGFSVASIVLTHGHFDHIGGADELRSVSGAKISALAEEKELLEDPWINVSAQMKKPVTLACDEFFHDGDTLSCGSVSCKVIATPGHTAGGACFYFEEGGFAICGDTLFAESIGRTDFPTGDMNTLIASVEKKIFTLPDETKLFPGHGPATTVGHEKEYNPFFS
ncbi:MAG: MBL fold metallo-hydrolase [Lachnospiraceae bacterium]|nr:MBL fold metallo-hydrolase [Lachnospiraceae bacterium]